MLYRPELAVVVAVRGGLGEVVKPSLHWFKVLGGGLRVKLVFISVSLYTDSMTGLKRTQKAARILGVARSSELELGAANLLLFGLLWVLHEDPKQDISAWWISPTSLYP